MAVKTIYLDLNVRLDNVDNTDTMTIPDSKAVKQSLWRLLNTKEGEIPYYRSYGLDLEQFCQAPMTKATAQDIHRYILGKVETFENRVKLASAPQVVSDMDTGYMSFTYHFYVKATGELIDLPTLNVYLGL